MEKMSHKAIHIGIHVYVGVTCNTTKLRWFNLNIVLCVLEMIQVVRKIIGHSAIGCHSSPDSERPGPDSDSRSRYFLGDKHIGLENETEGQLVWCIRCMRPTLRKITFACLFGYCCSAEESEMQCVSCFWTVRVQIKLTFRRRGR